MSINLVEKIREALNFPPLQKIDPNTQEVPSDPSKPDEHRFSQSAIPAILTGLYRFSTSDEGAETILAHDSGADWLSLIFGNTRDEVVDKVANYSFYSAQHSATHMNEIAAVATKLVRENIKPEGTKMDVKNFLSGQRHNILSYLPAALHMGDILRDDTIDDNTNKMEGPVSSLMHKLGSAFSNPPDEDDLKSKS